MSVVVKIPDGGDGRLVMLMKGADNEVLNLIKDKAEAPKKEEANRRLLELATKGLRTLVLARRDLTQDEYENWSKGYKEARAAVDDRARLVKDQILLLEEKGVSSLTLLGVTAIEDRLQYGVPETLEFVRNAGIKAWVLTGDKLETAIQIGRLCNLLKGIDNEDNAQFRGSTAAAVMQEIEAREATWIGAKSRERAITITGEALKFVLDSTNTEYQISGVPLRERFYRLAKDCSTVICCRVSPKQKADVVGMVKDLHGKFTQQQPITLAIGDGANDVSMIKAAHVGVGLSGKEGAQAARSADFAIGQFRFLKRLIFVHGRESYRRNSTVVNYNFYKNMVLVLPAALYGPSMAYSGQPFYEQVLYQLYNVLFSFFPAVLYAILDRPVKDLAELEKSEEHYKPALEKKFFGKKVFGVWALAGSLQACMIWFVGFEILNSLGKSDTGPDHDSLWFSGTGIYFWVVLGVNLTLFNRLSLTIFPNVITIVLSVLSFPIIVVMLEHVLFMPKCVGISPLLFGYPAWRYLLVTCLFVPLFLGLGEPLIRSVTYGQVSAPQSSCFSPLPKEELDP
jgi:phospholipid-transporting ATPase